MIVLRISLRIWYLFSTNFPKRIWLKVVLICQLMSTSRTSSTRFLSLEPSSQMLSMISIKVLELDLNLSNNQNQNISSRMPNRASRKASKKSRLLNLSQKKGEKSKFQIFQKIKKMRKLSIARTARALESLISGLKLLNLRWYLSETLILTPLLELKNSDFKTNK